VEPGVRDPEAEVAQRVLDRDFFANPPLLCSRVPEGTVATSAGIVLTAAWTWIRESVEPAPVSEVVPTNRLGRIEVDRPSRTMDEDVAVVFSVLSPKKLRNYHHWTIEGVTRAAMLARAGVPETAGVLVPAPLTDLHRQSLAAVGIDERRLIEWDGVPTRFRCVYVPTGPQHSGREPVAHALELIAEKAAGLTDWRTPRRRLWVSRRDAVRRPFAHEERLAAIAASYGFEEVRAERLPAADQLALFSTAEVVGGLHGAGLANAAYMARGGVVVEAATDALKARAKPYFWNLAAARGHGYACLVGPAAGHDPQRFEQLLAATLAA
jgi:capsular polysaccharide biosynthesis protein